MTAVLLFFVVLLFMPTKSERWYFYYLWYFYWFLIIFTMVLLLTWYFYSILQSRVICQRFLCPLKLWEIIASSISFHWKHQGSTLCLFDYMEPQIKVTLPLLLMLIPPLSTKMPFVRFDPVGLTITGIRAKNQDLLTSL